MVCCAFFLRLEKVGWEWGRAHGRQGSLLQNRFLVFGIRAGSDMNILRLYVRVLGLLGPERKLGWLLAIGNLALAAAQFAEPVLFGKVIDSLSGAQARGQAPSWHDLSILLAAWVGFGLFTIA